jgi:nucleoporin NDC1
LNQQIAAHLATILTVMQSFAMWELSLIAQKFEVRRKAIYADIDRKDGPMWSQVYGTCMEVIRSIETRADSYGKAEAPVAVAAPAVRQGEVKRDGIRQLSKDPIVRNARPHSSKAMQLIGQSAQSVGNSSDGSSLKKLSPYAKKTWKHAKDQLLSEEQQEAVSPEALRSRVGTITLKLINMGVFDWFQALLRQDYGTDLAAAALGTPQAEPWLYVNAVRALTQLAVHSLGEDQYGSVHRDVPSVIRTLTLVIRKVEDLKQRVPVHWTDAGYPKESTDVEQVLRAMRTGLGEVVASFEPYSQDLRLTPGDLRLAKEAAAEPKVQEEAPQPVEKNPPKNPPLVTQDQRRHRLVRLEMEEARRR